jgi:ABC-type nitrate/sulfonate/bicarbonate transport system substrate-binding protein
VNRTRRTLVAAAAAFAVLAAASGGARAAEASGKGITINIGYFPVVSPVPIMRTQHMLEDKGYTVNWVPITQGLPGAASAVAAGKLDIAWGNSISAVVIFSQSPDAAQFIGQSFINANVTVVAEKSPIKSAKDIVGKKVVVSGMKTASTLFFQIGLKKAGVDPNANEYFVSGTGPGMVGVLDSGGAEVVAGYVPYVADMVLKKIGRVLFTGSDAIGRPAPGDGFIASTSFIRAHPEAVKDVLRA